MNELVASSGQDAFRISTDAAQLCFKCNGTGWLHGCQRWTPAKMSRGTPYYSARCDCKKGKR